MSSAPLSGLASRTVIAFRILFSSRLQMRVKSSKCHAWMLIVIAVYIHLVKLM